MPSVNVPDGGEFTVVNPTTVSYNGTLYEGVTSIDYPDGTSKTCAQIIAESGGEVYSQSELKYCVKVEGYDPDQNNRQVFTVYSNNSKQVAKNETQQIPGGMWIEIRNYLGTEDTNPQLALMKQYGQDWSSRSDLLAFVMNYGQSELRSYVMTQLNPFNEESVPCPPTQIGTTLMHDVKLSGIFTSLPTIAGQRFVRPNLFKLYRSAVGSDGSASYLRVKVDALSQEPTYVGPYPFTIPAAVMDGDGRLFGFYFLDDTLAEDLLEPLQSLDWDAPPIDLRGLTAWRNGMMAAFKDSDLYICEPYRPFTFPQKYRQAVPRKILALRVDGNALVAITDGEPYIFTGSHPMNVSYERIDNARAGLAPFPMGWPTQYQGVSHAITTTPMGVIYATREGLEAIRGGVPQTLGRQLWTREEWAAAFGSSLSALRLAYNDGRLLIYAFGPAGQGWFYLLNIGDETLGLTQYLDGSWPLGHYTNPLDDSLYLLTRDAPGSATSAFSRFADEYAGRLYFKYWTRDVIVPRPVSFGALQIRGYGDNVAMTVAVYADQKLYGGRLVQMIQGDVSRRYNIRLPGGQKATRWSVYLTATGNVTVREIHLAETMADLASV